MRVLNLTLHKRAFEVMITGEKTVEYREDKTDWMRSRLFDSMGNRKEIDLVKFTNGYGADRPYFICKFETAVIGHIGNRYYSNGLVVPSGIYWQIFLGEIIEKGNLK